MNSVRGEATWGQAWRRWTHHGAQLAAIELLEAHVEQHDDLVLRGDAQAAEGGP